MATSAVFSQARTRQGMYESFYLRAVAPHQPLGVWIRHTVQKPREHAAQGSLWCTVFDATRGAPFMHKLTSDRLHVPRDGWIEVGDRDEHARAGGSLGASSSTGEGGSMGTSRVRPSYWNAQGFASTVTRLISKPTASSARCSAVGSTRRMSRVAVARMEWATTSSATSSAR